MSAGKLSRYTGLVFVLAAIFSGVGAADLSAEHGTGGSTIAVNSDVVTHVTAGDARLVRISLNVVDYEWT